MMVYLLPLVIALIFGAVFLIRKFAFEDDEEDQDIDKGD